MVEGRWLCRCLHRREWLSEAGRLLDAAEDARTAGDGEPRRLPLEIRETAPAVGNVRRENEREPALNIERGLNSKISLRAAHWARSLQAPAFERERWVLRDRNIYLRTCEGKRERQNFSEKERDREKAMQECEREMKAKESRGKGEKLPFPLDPEIHTENNVSGLTRGPWPLTCSFR